MKSRNKVFVGIVTLSIIVMGLTAIIGYGQISDRKNDYILYVQAKENAKNGKIEESILELDNIEKKYGESDVLKIDKASIYLNSGQSEKAQIELSNAFELNPTLHNNVNLMLAYAQTAYENNDKDTVTKMIKKSEEFVKGEEDSFKKRKIEIPDEIKEMKKKIKEMKSKLK